MQEFKTIREVAQTKLISEWYLRKMVKDGTVPGVYRGNRFMVNFTLFSEQLDRESRAAIRVSQ